MPKVQALTLRTAGLFFIGLVLCAAGVIYLYALAREADELHYCNVLTPAEYPRVNAIIAGDDSDPKVYDCLGGAFYRGRIIIKPDGRLIRGFP